MIPLARFISKYREQSFVARPTRSGHDKWGQPFVLQEPIVCDFSHGGLSPWEKQAGLDRFNFGSVGYDEDVSRRLSVYDTELEAKVNGWDAETLALVEERLRGGMSFGVDYFEVEHPKTPAPWPAYPKLTVQGRRTVEMVAQTIAEKVSEDGHDPNLVIAHERENQNREEVIAALEALLAPDPEEPVIAA